MNRRRIAPAALSDLVRFGFAEPILPATDAGWKRYGLGREFLPAAVNHVANSSFELDTNADGVADGVVLTGATAEATLSRVAGRLGGSAQRMQATFDGSPSDGYFALASSAAGTFAQGNVATFAGYIRGSVAGIACQAYVVVRNASDAPINTSLQAFTLSTEWQRITVSRTCDVGADRARGGFYFSGIGAGDTIDVVMDDFQLEKAAAATPYFNGSYPDCAWSGVAHASASIRPASALSFAGLVSVDHAGATALGGQTLYSRTSGVQRGPIVVAAAAYSAAEQAVLAAAWGDPFALFRAVKIGDCLFPLGWDSVGYRKVQEVPA